MSIPLYKLFSQTKLSLFQFTSFVTFLIISRLSLKFAELQSFFPSTIKSWNHLPDSLNSLSLLKLKLKFLSLYLLWYVLLYNHVIIIIISIAMLLILKNTWILLACLNFWLWPTMQPLTGLVRLFKTLTFLTFMQL